ncbi:8283_t:CDS:2, partial [Racocetra persica]
SEQSYRTGIFSTGSVIAGAFSGFMAFYVMGLDGNFGLSGWQWIFLIDGLITVLIAFFSYFLIADYPETTSWLANDERKTIINRIQIDSGQISITNQDKYQIVEAFKDWKVYMFSIIYFSISVPEYSFFFFLPSIVNGLGFDSVRYTGTCIIGMGVFSSVPLATTWLTNNLAGDLKRAVGCALLVASGNVGGMIS